MVEATASIRLRKVFAVCGLGIAGLVGATAGWAQQASDDGAAAPSGAYAQLSDARLQALVGEWDTLSGDERRALLTEVHRRMLEAGKKPVLRIRAERRFGYRIERPDGSVVEIERRQGIVRYQPLNPDKPFGVGFEQRVEGGAGSEADIAEVRVPAVEAEVSSGWSGREPGGDREEPDDGDAGTPRSPR